MSNYCKHYANEAKYAKQDPRQQDFFTLVAMGCRVFGFPLYSKKGCSGTKQQSDDCQNAKRKNDHFWERKLRFVPTFEQILHNFHAVFLTFASRFYVDL